MAETFAQRTKAVNQSVRRIRATYRRADSAGEIFERELDRLINRKTIVSPATLLKLAGTYESFTRAVLAIEINMADALRVASSYMG